MHQAIDPGLNSALTGLGSAKLKIKPRSMSLEGVSSFGFGGTNGRCDIWGAARLIAVGSACLVRWRTAGLLHYRLGRFGPNKCGKVMEAEVDQIYTLCLGPSWAVLQRSRRSIGPQSSGSCVKLGATCHGACLNWDPRRRGPVTLGKIDHLTGEPLSRRLAAMRRTDLPRGCRQERLVSPGHRSAPCTFENGILLTSSGIKMNP